jgi:hypothetical protein
MIQSTDVKSPDVGGWARGRLPEGPARARLTVVAALAIFAFLLGLLVGASGGDEPGREVADRFTSAWESSDWARMHSLTDPGTQTGMTASRFAARYRRAASTATTEAIRFGEPSGPRAGVVVVPATVDTRLWGEVRAELRLPVSGGEDDPRIAWSERLVFPGLRDGERLRREIEMPERASLLFRDNTPIARGEARTSPSPVAPSIRGELGEAPEDRLERLRELGVPEDARVGTSGLERVFDERLIGRPGGTLYAGERELASSEPRRGENVRTSISPDVQAAAVTALAGRFGGTIALDPANGEILGAAGIAWSALQPPGSTFKIVTLAAALEKRLAGPNSQYPVQTETLLSGVPLENANGESCGGNLVQSFAHSCNTVFAPLGAKVGAEHLVRTARRFGFDEDPEIPGAVTSTIPDADEIGDDLAVGSSAIGQGRVQATALQMAIVAAAIAGDGVRPRPTLLYGDRREPARATTERVAARIEPMMKAVVEFGTGTSAAIPGVPVAGKTGTAELENTVESATGQEGEEAIVDDTTDTDAWFVAYAPAAKRREPRAAVGVLLVRAGAGGDVAAPAARSLLVAALQATD